MSTQPGPGASNLNLRGAVDLSSLGKQPQTSGAGASGSQGSWVIDADEQSLGDVVQMSMNVPVVIYLWSASSEQSTQLAPIMGKLTDERQGRILLAKIDTTSSPNIMQAFGVQSVPSVVAFIKGQPVPLFQGTQPEDQIRQIIEQLLHVAEQNGVNGVLPGQPGSNDSDSDSDHGPQLPAHVLEANEALQRGDYDAALAAYDGALSANPGDEEARLGRAQVVFLQRVSGYDANAVRAGAADNPDDLDAQMKVADLDIAGGHVEDGLLRLIDLIRGQDEDTKNKVRDRLVSLFDVVGPTDPRVSSARRLLANALFS